MTCGNRKMNGIAWIALLAAVTIAATVSAATPPDRINYQGVLRNAADAPLDGDFDMVFRLWSSEIAGDEILLDRHLSVNLEAVTVTGGLFTAAIGSGEVIDGSGPGTYATLSEVFRDYGDVWLEVQVGSETLAPRIAVSAAGYALNSSHLDGQPAGHFLDTSSTAQTKTGDLIVDASGLVAYGIEAAGDLGGGYFWDGDNSGHAYVGSADWGIAAYGNEGGGYFLNLDSTAQAYLGYYGYGIWSAGYDTGGRFEDIDGTGIAWVGLGDDGIHAYGTTAGGYFRDSDDSGRAYVGYGDYGIQGYGDAAGGYFEDDYGNGYAYLGIASDGIHAYGDSEGGFFQDLTSGTQGRIAYGIYSIYGNGTKAFAQNHPDDPSRKIVYTALEGNEAGTYSRGSARLEDGFARIALDETFAWVTNPDVGLTAQITPREECHGIRVVSLTTEELVVQELGDGHSDAAFDWVVMGLRIGFEEVPTVQPKEEGESLPIPSMAEHRALLEEQPELQSFTPLERFRTMEARAFPGRYDDGLDLSRSHALVAAIHEFDPATDAVPRPESLELPPGDPADAASEVPSAAETPDEVVASPDTVRIDDRSAPITSPSLAGSSPDARLPLGLILLPVSDAVEVGDLLMLDPERPGALRVATTMADPGVVGVAVVPPSPGADGTGEVAVLSFGFATIKADAGYGAIRAGDLLTSSATPGHAMLALGAEPGTIVGKALEPLDVGTGTIRVLLMAR